MSHLLSHYLLSVGFELDTGCGEQNTIIRDRRIRAIKQVNQLRSEMKKQNVLTEHGGSTQVYGVDREGSAEKVAYLRPRGQKVQPYQQLREGYACEGPGLGDLGV